MDYIIARTVSSELLVYLLLVFPYLFVFVSCANLGWPSCQLLSARKYIVSYRIVCAVHGASAMSVHRTRPSAAGRKTSVEM